MAWNFAYTPMIWLSIAAISLLLGLAIYCLHQKDVSAALPLAICSLFAIIWTIGSGFEEAAIDLSTKIFWHKFQGTIILFGLTAFTCFILEYAWPGRWLTRRNLLLLYLAPTLFLSLALLGDPGNLLWRGFSFDKGLVTLRGPLNWLLISYGYILGGVDIAVMIYIFSHSQEQRWAVAMLFGGHFVGFLSFLLEVIDPIKFYLPYASMGITFSFLMYAFALFRYRILDPIPLVRRTFVNQMPSGLIALDSRQKILIMNPSAEKILKIPIKTAKGKSLSELLPAYSELQSGNNFEKTVEFNLNSENATHDFVLRSSNLKDWHETIVGELLLISDVTEKNKVQKIMLEQQRALASLQEREHLARELHDDLTQVLAFINTQGQTVRRLLARGELETADSYLARLVEVARSAEVDIRESIRGMRLTLSGKGLFATLEKYLEHYEQSYAIHTELTRSELFVDNTLDAIVEAQLLRVLQEALTNVRKHAFASQVRIQFDMQDIGVCICIKDDGRGFDLSKGEIDTAEHFGLQMMRERIDAIGGSIQVSSQPGQGTEVLVCVPVEANKPN